MRVRRLAAAALIVGGLALAGCGSDDKPSSTAPSYGAPSTTAPAQAPPGMASLQRAASDVVRATSQRDEERTRRAFDAFNRLLEANRAAIESKGVDVAERIDNQAMAVGEALDMGDLGKASRAARGLQQAVDAAQ